MLSLSPLVKLLALLMWPGVTQQSPCSLLSASEIESTTGAKPGDSHAMDMEVPNGPTKGEKVNSCLWPVPAHQGQVAVSMARVPAGVTRKQIEDNPGVNALREKGWKEERKEIDNGSCSVFTPPASQKDGIFLSSCTVVTKTVMMSVVFMSPTKKLSIDQTKGLLDRMLSRQH